MPARYLITVLLTISCGKMPFSSMKDEFSGEEFYYYNKEDRLEMLDQLKKGLSDHYSLRDIKKRRLGIDTDTLFATHREAESAIEDVTGSQNQAVANLAYIDRTRQLIARYRDTHMRTLPVVPSPVIMNGLELKKVNGSFYVAALRRKLLKYVAISSAAASSYDKISLGDKVVSIDGRSPQDHVDILKKFESASSENFAQEVSTKRLTVRDYAYPEKPYTDYEFLDANGQTYKVRLPYFYETSGALRADAKYLLEKRGFLPLRQLKLLWSEEHKTWTFDQPIPIEGFDRWQQVPEGLIAIQEWEDQDFMKDLVLRTGYLLKNGKSYGVIQLFTYMVGNMKNKTTGEILPFEEGLQNFIKELRASETPLILDLRNNGGGITGLPSKVLSAIAMPDQVYPTFTRSYRVTRHIRQMLETNSPAFPGLVDYDGNALAFQVLHQAIMQHKNHTDAFDATAKIRSSIGGYKEKVAVLITPNCISSCDITAMLMEASHRTTIIGSHSNGTGAGMTSNLPFAGTEWTDGFNVLKVNIPNFLFGRPGSMEASVHRADAYYELNSENVPVTATIQYDYTLDDILHGSRGWFAKAIEALK